MNNNKITHKQLMAIAFISLLSPIIRIVPVGYASWLSPVIAIVPIALHMIMMSSFLKNRKENEGLAHMFMRSVGKTGGKAVALLFALWGMVYAGFVLRMGSERLLSSVYANGSVSFFVVVTLLVSLIGAFGNIKNLARSAQILVLMISSTLVIIFVFALTSVKTENLLPVSYLNSGDILYGAVPVANVICVFSYFTFLSAYVKRGEDERRITLKWGAGMLVLLFGVLITTIGALSINLAKNVQNPFFVVIRDITIFNTVERIESIVIAMWAMSDFVYLSSIITIVSEMWCVVTNTAQKKWFVVPIAAVALVSAFAIAPNAFALKRFADIAVPGIHFILTFFVLPAVFIIGKIRKKI